MTTADIIRVDRPTTSSKLFAHTRWDAIPVLASLPVIKPMLSKVSEPPSGAVARKLSFGSLPSVLGSSLLGIFGFRQ